MKTTDHLPTFRKKKQRRKLIRGLICFSPVIALFFLVTAIYIASYQEQIKEQEKRPPDQQGILIQAGQREESAEKSDSHKPLHTPQQGQIEEILKDQDAQPVDDNTDIYITPKMSYTLEIYDARSEQLTSETLPIPNDMYGLNRIQLEEYLNSLALLENESLTDVDHHYEVRLFSRKEFIVRQIITQRTQEDLLEDRSRYAIFLIAENGYLTAYSGDRTKVLEHTQIPLGDFPLAQQDMLTRGIYMKTWTDYYDFLESYSS